MPRNREGRRSSRVLFSSLPDRVLREIAQDKAATNRDRTYAAGLLARRKDARAKLTLTEVTHEHLVEAAGRRLDEAMTSAERRTVIEIVGRCIRRIEAEIEAENAA